MEYILTIQFDVRSFGGPNDMGSALYFRIIWKSKKSWFFGLSIKMFLANQFKI